MNREKIIKPLLLITAIIFFCSVFIRIFSGSETLAEYAAQNPGGNTVSETGNSENGTPKGSPEKIPPEQGQSNGHNMSQGDNPVPYPADSNPPDNASADTAHEANQTNSNSEASNINAKSASASASSQEHQNSEDNDMTINPDRITYKYGFYYEPLSKEMIKRITGISYPVTESEKDNTLTKAVNIVSSANDIQISYDDLCYMSVLHYNFHGVERIGELICNKAIAQDLVEIFYELYQNEYQIEQIRLIDEYNGDDTLSIQDNNTSCFNYRVVDGTSSLSKHAMGLAIDINPFFNPYVVFRSDGSTYISPQGSETYADRSQNFAYKIDENDLCYKLFKEHGFIWGGNWNSCKDYQHFQKTPG